MREIDSGYKKLILVCVNEREAGEDACGNRNSRDIHLAIKQRVKAMGLGKVYRVSRSRCLGQCERGPTVVVWPEGTWYGGVTIDDVDEIISRHIK